MQQKGFAPILVIVGLLVFGLGITGAYYLGTKKNTINTQDSLKSKEVEKSLDEGKKFSVLDIIKNRPKSTPTSTPKTSVKSYTQVDSPEKYGYTNVIELPVVGIKAKFTQDSKASLDGSNFYNVGTGSDHIMVSLEDYSGGGRRAWFQKNHSGFADTFIPFTTKAHSGYIAYLKNGLDKNNVGFYFYFTSLNSNKMLVIQGYNSKEGNNYFRGDLNKFKSFLSDIELTKIDASQNNNLKISDYLKWSGNRITLWEDYTVGLRITAPDWIDYRSTTSRNVDGSYNFGEWQRSIPKALTYKGDNPKTTTVNIQYWFTNDYLHIYEDKYRNEDFNNFVYSELFPAGFCRQEWKNSKAECLNKDYCYTKDDVIQSLRLKKQILLGNMSAQLRGIDEEFSKNNDCRGEDTWLIKAKTGQFITSDISPDSEIVKLEAL